jgi:hypothetical protein
MTDPTPLLARLGDLAQEHGLAVQVLAVLLSALGVHRQVRRLRQSVQHFRSDIFDLLARVSDLEVAEARLPEVPPRVADSRIAGRVLRAVGRAARRAAGGAPALALLLGVLLAGSAGAVQQSVFSAGAYPQTVYLGASGSVAYGVRFQQYLPEYGKSGFSPLALEVTSLTGAVTQITVIDDSVFAVATRRLRVVGGPTVGNYYVTVYESAGEIAPVGRVPVLPANTSPRDLFDTLPENPFTIDGGTAYDSSLCVAPVPVTPVPGQYAGAVVLRFDSWDNPATRQAHHLVVEVEGLSAGLDAGVALAGSGTLKVYFMEYNARQSGGRWNRVSTLDTAIGTGEVAWAAAFTLEVPGLWCFVPSGVTGADKLRLRLHYTQESR